MASWNEDYQGNWKQKLFRDSKISSSNHFKLKILSLNAELGGGGANQIAWTLCKSFQNSGHISSIISRSSNFTDKNIRLIQNDLYRNSLFKYFEYLSRKALDKNFSILPNLFQMLARISEPRRFARNLLGMEDFDFPGTNHLSRICNYIPDLIHAHNLHSDFFDLRQLSYYSNKFPFFLTLHDCWTFTGHCCHFFECSRWMENCGKCPHLDLPIKLSRDGTKSNLNLKRKIFSKSKIHISTPSHWLARKVEKSILAPAIKSLSVIPNGVNQDTFKPADKIDVRRNMGIPEDDFVISFSCNSPSQNPWKNYKLVEDVIQILSNSDSLKRITFLIMGEDGGNSNHKHVSLKKLGWLSNKSDIAKVYQASDLYLHATKADTYPTVIMEAMSCGTPVIASDVGGISEQVSDKIDGRILHNSPDAFATMINRFLLDNEILKSYSERALQKARRDFNQNDMTSKYHDWYLKGISEFSRN